MRRKWRDLRTPLVFFHTGTEKVLNACTSLHQLHSRKSLHPRRHQSIAISRFVQTICTCSNAHARVLRNFERSYTPFFSTFAVSALARSPFARIIRAAHFKRSLLAVRLTSTFHHFASARRHRPQQDNHDAHQNAPRLGPRHDGLNYPRDHYAYDYDYEACRSSSPPLVPPRPSSLNRARAVPRPPE